MNWIRHSVSTTFETKSSYCRVARQGLPSVSVLHGSSTTWFQTSRYCRAKVEFNSINCVRHGSSTTFETGLTWIHYTKIQYCWNRECSITTCQKQRNTGLSVRNIPKFKDRANWSRDTFQPMRRRACVYQNTNQNINSTCWSKIFRTLKTHTTMTTLTTLTNNPYNPDYRNPWLD